MMNNIKHFRMYLSYTKEIKEEVDNANCDQELAASFPEIKLGPGVHDRGCKSLNNTELQT